MAPACGKQIDRKCNRNPCPYGQSTRSRPSIFKNDQERSSQPAAGVLSRAPDPGMAACSSAACFQPVKVQRLPAAESSRPQAVLRRFEVVNPLSMQQLAHIREARPQMIFPQRRITVEYLRVAPSRRKQIDHEFNRNTRSFDDRLARQNSRIDHNSLAPVHI
jgi:hypothetical protein